MSTDDTRGGSPDRADGAGRPEDLNTADRPDAPHLAEISTADARALTAALTELADDTDAPPSTVTADAVLAAARAPGRGRNGLTAVPGEGRTAWTRRRTGLVALVAAASLAGIAAIVVPLTLGGLSTNTASNSASEVVAGSAAEQSAAGDQAAGANAAGAAPELDSGSAAADASGAASGPAAVSAPGASDAGQPPGGGQAAAAAPSGDPAVTQSCWPPLPAAALTALTAALPPGAFAAPVALDGGCARNPVAGAVLPGAVPGTELVVRVVEAAPGACARSAGEAGSRCVASGEDSYTATDPSGGMTVLVYGDGKQVEVGSLTSVDGVPSVPSGLSADQLAAAARAVLGALQ